MRKGWLWAAVAGQVLVLAALIAAHAYTLAAGVAVRLKTEPLDPFDPLRGAYVHLRPSIARLDLSLYPGDAAALRSGDTLWVTLQRDEPDWRAVAVGTARPAVHPDQVAVQAQVQYVSTEGSPGINVGYAFQDFFVTQAQADELSQRRTGIDIVVRVDRFGHAALDQVLVDGQALDWQ